ncbi:MAG TPA: OmpA family protein, partial [Bacteroidales bacterium]|nr:OmpA family protein [Bacteroidales bacterium]
YRSDKGNGDIYYSELNNNGKWSILKEFPVINSQYRETHASLSPDGKTLYFTSDRPGGYGGLDIWKTELGENGWLEPENLGPIINTKYNEDAPFILPDGVTLYFSSQGHENMGGYDIFFTNLTEDGFWNPPTNIGYPINSPDNDVFYYPSPDEKYAFFSSADIKGYGDQDLYLMNIISSRTSQLKLIVRTIDASSFKPVKADIVIHDNINNNIVYELLSDESGYGEAFLNYDKKYLLTASAPGYITNNKIISILHDDPRSVILMDIFLEKAEIAQLNQQIAEATEPVKEPLKVGETIILRNIYFDFDKATLRPQSIEELDHLYQFLVNNPTAIIEISAHTDRIGSYEYNINLSKRRAQAVVDYLINKGIDSKRLITKGYGFTKPVATNLTEEGRQLNRRVEFKILSYDEKELESILNPPKSFYIIGASTIDYDDAEYIRNNYIKKGFKNATIITDDENKRFRIAYENYQTKQEAVQRLTELKAITGQSDLWILEN